MEKCKAKTEVYSRVVGYYRPVQQWNEGKKLEFSDRKTYKAGEMQDGKNYNDTGNADPYSVMHYNKLQISRR